jgi:hypothetical protein
MTGVGKVENLATDALVRHANVAQPLLERLQAIFRDQGAKNPLPVPGNCPLLKSLQRLESIFAFYVMKLGRANSEQKKIPDPMQLIFRGICVLGQLVGVSELIYIDRISPLLSCRIAVFAAGAAGPGGVGRAR